MPTTPRLILASTSIFRQQLLSRLHIDFETFSPNIDETALPNESPNQLVLRLAQSKAETAQNNYENALIIGSDQVAVLAGKEILGKPGDHERAVQQLEKASGQQVDFLTGLCVLNTATGQAQVDSVSFGVRFRELQRDQIERYLRKDEPYNCSGSFKSEGLGIALLESMQGTDPTTVIGLPLIRLVAMLEAEGMQII